jgi:hypothetical protein
MMHEHEILITVEREGQHTRCIECAHGASFVTLLHCDDTKRVGLMRIQAGRLVCLRAEPPIKLEPRAELCAGVDLDPNESTQLEITFHLPEAGTYRLRLGVEPFGQRWHGRCEARAAERRCQLKWNHAGAHWCRTTSGDLRWGEKLPEPPEKVCDGCGLYDGHRPGCEFG